MKYSCYYIFCFGCLMGFIIHFYIIFGTNLLTGGPTQFPFFCLFQCFEEKEYQMESKRNETFGRVIFGTEATQETWKRCQGSFEEATRQGGVPYPLGAPSTLAATSWLFWLALQVSWVSFGPRKIIMKFYSVWTPFSIPFLRSSKTRKKQKIRLDSV